MQDKLGKKLALWRTEVVLPKVKGKLLDIGCGNNLLVKKWGNGVGVDVFPWLGVDIVVENCATLPFDDGEFDTITILAALNHIPNRELVLKELHRLLAVDGRVIITMLPPFLSMIWHRLRFLWDDDQSRRGKQEGELYGFTHHQVLDLLTFAGFVMDSKEKFMFNINALYLFRKGR